MKVVNNIMLQQNQTGRSRKPFENIKRFVKYVFVYVLCSSFAGSGKKCSGTLLGRFTCVKEAENE